MKMVRVEAKRTKLWVYSPYHPGFIARVRDELPEGAARWDKRARCWQVDAELEPRLRQILRDVYGEDDTRELRRVTVLVDVLALGDEAWDESGSRIWICGRELLSARSSGEARMGDEVRRHVGGAVRLTAPRQLTTLPAGCVLAVDHVPLALAAAERERFGVAVSLAVMEDEHAERERELTAERLLEVAREARALGVDAATALAVLGGAPAQPTPAPPSVEEAPVSVLAPAPSPQTEQPELDPLAELLAELDPTALAAEVVRDLVGVMGLSARQFGELLGLSRQAVYRAQEHGVGAGPQAALLRMMAEAAGVPVSAELPPACWQERAELARALGLTPRRVARLAEPGAQRADHEPPVHARQHPRAAHRRQFRADLNAFHDIEALPPEETPALVEAVDEVVSAPDTPAPSAQVAPPAPVVAARWQGGVWTWGRARDTRALERGWPGVVHEEEGRVGVVLSAQATYYGVNAMSLGGGPDDNILIRLELRDATYEERRELYARRWAELRVREIKAQLQALHAQLFEGGTPLDDGVRLAASCEVVVRSTPGRLDDVLLIVEEGDRRGVWARRSTYVGTETRGVASSEQLLALIRSLEIAHGAHHIAPWHELEWGGEVELCEGAWTPGAQLPELTAWRYEPRIWPELGLIWIEWRKRKPTPAEFIGRHYTAGDRRGVIIDAQIRSYGLDAPSFGGRQDTPWAAEVTVRDLTDDEAAAQRAKVAAAAAASTLAERQAAAKARLHEIYEAIERQGERLYDGQDMRRAPRALEVETTYTVARVVVVSEGRWRGVWAVNEQGGVYVPARATDELVSEVSALAAIVTGEAREARVEDITPAEVQTWWPLADGAAWEERAETLAWWWAYHTQDLAVARAEALLGVVERGEAVAPWEELPAGELLRLTVRWRRQALALVDGLDVWRLTPDSSVLAGWEIEGRRYRATRVRVTPELADELRALAEIDAWAAPERWAAPEHTVAAWSPWLMASVEAPRAVGTSEEMEQAAADVTAATGLSVRVQRVYGARRWTILLQRWPGVSPDRDQLIEVGGELIIESIGISDETLRLSLAAHLGLALRDREGVTIVPIAAPEPPAEPAEEEPREWGEDQLAERVAELLAESDSKLRASVTTFRGEVAVSLWRNARGRSGGSQGHVICRDGEVEVRTTSARTAIIRLLRDAGLPVLG